MCKSELNALCALCLARGCSLIVAGRVDEDKTFKTMDDVVLPEPLHNLVGHHSPPHQTTSIARALLSFFSGMAMTTSLAGSEAG